MIFVQTINGDSMEQSVYVEELLNGLNMGMIAIDNLIDKIEKPKLRDIVLHQRKEYGDLKMKILHTSPYVEDEVKNKFMLESMVKIKTMMSSDDKIAKMLIEGSQQAVITMTHLLNKEERVDMKLKSYMNDFEDISKRYIEELKAFV